MVGSGWEQKRRGLGIVGLTAGISSVFYTLTTAWIIVYSNSLATCLYCIGGFQALISGWIVFSMRSGKLAAPPKPADVKEWMDQQQENAQKVAAEVPDEGDDKKKKTPTDVKEWMDQQHEKVQEIATEAPGEGDDREIESDSEKTIRPFGTSASIPVILKDRKEAFRYPVFYANNLITACTAINGCMQPKVGQGQLLLHIIYSYASSVSHIFTVFPIRRNLFGCLYSASKYHI
jgi:hypothetical protein